MDNDSDPEHLTVHVGGEDEVVVSFALYELLQKGEARMRGGCPVQVESMAVKAPRWAARERR